jgi:uncharacterized protein (TIGR02246 family)
MNTLKWIAMWALCALLMGINGAAAEQGDKVRAAITAQTEKFTEAVTRGDAKTVAGLFTSDAILLVAGVQAPVSGRAAIETFWQRAVSGSLKDLRFTTAEIHGDGALWVETGSYVALGPDAAELGRGNYLFVWKKEAGEWKIYRDAAASSPPTVSMRDVPNASVASELATDRVGFPKGYPSTFRLLSVAERNEAPEIITVYGNNLAASVTNADQLPYANGSVIVMEWANALKDDSAGQPRKGEIVRVDVMRRAEGFGEAYGANRAGNWEFMRYAADGSQLPSPPPAECAACHAKAGAAKDYVYRRSKLVK